MSVEEMKKYMGTKLDGKHASRSHSVKSDTMDNLPDTFDSAQNWPNCANSINYIKDQAACGSCWAVAASEVAGDRSCIECGAICPGNGEVGLNEQQPCFSLSAAQLMSCCSYCGQGCQGGYPIDAMQFWHNTGLVTGGWYNSKCGCYPYTVSPTDHQEHPTPSCQNTCPTSGYPVAFNQDKHYAKDSYQLKTDEKHPDIVKVLKTEISSYGPIECAFQVYYNFMHYPNGGGVQGPNQVYTEKSGEYMGGHAIKIVGWGKDPVAGEYWIIHNSWNTTWGRNGVFNFKMGTNLCGMEEQCVAGRPKCSNAQAASNKLTCVN